jgi:glycosyltransferase involved in cell wall biosynthesis
VRLLLDVSAVPAHPVGAGVYTVELAGGLAGHDDLDLHLLARRDDAARWADLAPKAAVHPEVPETRPARILWEQTHGPDLAARLAVDVWHGPHYTMPLRLRIPAAVTVHDLTFFDHPEWHERSKVAFFRPMLRVSVKRARALIAVSEYTASRLAARLNPRAPVVVAPHGVDHHRFRPAPRRGADDLAALRHLGIRPPYIAFAGTIEPRKDIPALVAAFSRVAPTRPDLRLVIAGRDGWGAEAVRDAVAESGVTTRIMRPGWFPGELLPVLYRQSEAVAYPSLEEGFGLPALEALACGAALVTTSGSAMAEVVGDAALLVEPGDVRGLARALTRVLDDATLADQLRRAGPPQAAPFTWEESIERHLAAYRLAAGIPA